MNRNRLLPNISRDDDDDRPIDIPIFKRPPKLDPEPRFEPKLHECRDPRFDPRCGEYDERRFSESYSFVREIKDKELNELEKMLRKERNSKRRQEIKTVIQRIKNQQATERFKEMKRKRFEELKKKKEELFKQNKDGSSTVTKGSKKIYVIKSELKKVQMVEKFKELKESGKLSRYLERKRKKLINKDSKSYKL